MNRKFFFLQFTKFLFLGAPFRNLQSEGKCVGKVEWLFAGNAKDGKFFASDAKNHFDTASFCAWKNFFILVPDWWTERVKTHFVPEFRV